MGQYDVQRKPIRRAVLHHTVTSDKATWKNISDIGKNRTYAGYPHSYHYDPETGQETFIAYHFLVYKDGRIRRCLQDNEIGWHAGNWEINREAIGVSFVGDYSNEDPTDAQIKAVAELLRVYDGLAGGNLQVSCHKEVSQTSTGCPMRVCNFRDKIVQLINTPEDMPNTEREFQVCFITVNAKWPEQAEVNDFLNSGKLPYQYVQDKYLYPMLEGLRSEVKAREYERDQANNQLGSKIQEVEQLRVEIGETKTRLLTKTKQLDDMTVERDTLKNQKVALQLQVDELTKTASDLQIKYDESYKQLEAIREEANTLRDLVVTQKTKIDELEKKLKQTRPTTIKEVAEAFTVGEIFEALVYKITGR